MSSLSASAENISSAGVGTGSGANGIDGAGSSDTGGTSMCLELALEGERLCKAGDCRAGVAFFQAAIQAGTDDLRTLSAIYSQLGNAYFYLGDYAKAMHYHKLDLTLARSMNDKLGEAKSSGNLGNTLKVMGRFDEAAMCCERHLTLARQLGDKLSEGRALYNLGNVFHAKGKHMGQRKPADFGDDVKGSLTKAVDYYQENLQLMRELGDRGAQGRACGNLGNTYYLLGDFEAAINHHHERLRIAREFGDKAAQRRANSNLGNSHIFLGQFEQAAEHYKRTLELAIELAEREVEAQSCYSLGNTYTLLREFDKAIEYHERHLSIAQELCDRVGEARACWSLGNAYSSIGDHERGLQYAENHLKLASELQDSAGESTARVNISDLRKLLGLPEVTYSPTVARATERRGSNGSDLTGHQSDGSESSQGRMIRMRRQSMEQLDLIKITPDGKQRAAASAIIQTQEEPKVAATKPKAQDDDFFELLSRSQSKRMDDQRCSISITKNPTSSNNVAAAGVMRKPLVQQNSISTMGTGGQAVEGVQLPGLKSSSTGGAAHAPLARSATITHQPDDAFLDMLMRCQGSRLEEQRSELPRASITMDAEAADPLRSRPPRAGVGNDVIGSASSSGGGGSGGATVPDEDFFSLIMKVQSGRMEDQRAAIPFVSQVPRPANAGNK